MNRLGGALLAAGAMAAGGTSLEAAAYTFGGTVNLRAGYGDNPGITQAGNGGSGLVGTNIAATLSRATTLGTTTLTGNVDLEENFRKYGFIDNYTLSLSHSQRLSERLSVNGSLGYQNTLNRLGGYAETTGFYDPSGIDFLAVGRRSERYYGSAGASWTPTARDSFQFSGTYSHSGYNGPFASDYNQYGANFSYLRTITDRTRVGALFGYNTVKSSGYPDAQSYNASLQLSQQIGATWQLNATAGLLIQDNGGTSRLLPVRLGKTKTTTPSFSVDLCGNYPRYNVCVSASRTSSPTGIGGLRVNTNVGTTVTYRLTEHSRVSVAGSYNVATSQGLVVPKQTYYSVQGNYYRDLNRRISVGGSGRYQRQQFGRTQVPPGFPVAPGGSYDGYELTANLSYKFGRF